MRSELARQEEQDSPSFVFHHFCPLERCCCRSNWRRKGSGHTWNTWNTWNNGRRKATTQSSPLACAHQGVLGTSQALGTTWRTYTFQHPGHSWNAWNTWNTKFSCQWRRLMGQCEFSAEGGGKKKKKTISSSFLPNLMRCITEIVWKFLNSAWKMSLPFSLLAFCFADKKDDDGNELFSSQNLCQNASSTCRFLFRFQLYTVHVCTYRSKRMTIFISWTLSVRRTFPGKFLLVFM